MPAFARTRLILKSATFALSIAVLALPIESMANPVRFLPRMIALDTGLLATEPGMQQDSIILAQTDGGSGAPSPTPERKDPVINLVASPRETAKIVRQINTFTEFCIRLPLIFHVDCLQWNFEKLARGLPRTGDYAPLRAVLDQAAKRLDVLVVKNSDPGVSRITPRIPNKPLAPSVGPLAAIRPAELPRVMAEAAAIVDDTSTILLRSTENSERRQIAYQEIAVAIDSTKVLLRSA